MIRLPPLKLVYRSTGSKWLTPKANPYNVPELAEDFIRSCRIRTGKGYQRFDLYDYQVELLNLLVRHSYIIVVKDRQLGITELLAAFCYWQSLIDPAYSAAFVSITQDKCAEISDRIKGMAPSDWGVKWQKKNNSELHPSSAGVMRFLTSSEDAARGLPAVNLFCLDEAGFLENFVEIYGAGGAAQETVPIDRRKTIINTTIPIEGQSHPVWGMFTSDNDKPAIDALLLARNGGTNCDIPGMVHWIDREGCCKVVIGHKAHPVYGKDPNFIDSVKKRRKIPDSIAQREYNLGIEVAGSSLFNSAAIDQYAIGQWEEPQPNRKYFAMVDPNFGGSDNFVCLIIDITDPQYRLVNEYAEADRSIEYSEGKTIALADWYGCKAIAIESNSGGKIVVESIQKKRPQLEVLLTLTSQSSKRTNTDRIALAIEQGQLIYPTDWEGKAEMRSFSASKREATAGDKDDRVMALAAGFAHIDEAASQQEIYDASFGGEPLTINNLG